MGRYNGLLLITIFLNSCDHLAVRDEPGLCFGKKNNSDGSDAVYFIDQRAKDIATKGRLIAGEGKKEIIISGFDGAYREVPCPAVLKAK